MVPTLVLLCRAPSGKRPSCSYIANQTLVPPSVLQTLDCCFCMKTVMRPVQHKCGSVFCDACVEQWQIAQQNFNKFTQCPMCREYIEHNMVPVALPVRHILMNMRAKCDNCVFEGSVECVLHHIQNQTHFVCVNRCGAVNLTLATMRDHYVACSQQRYATCDYDCGMHGHLHQVREHMRRCENRHNGERICPIVIEMRSPLEHWCPLRMIVDVQFADGTYEKAQIVGYTDLGLIVKTQSSERTVEASVFEHNPDIAAHVVLDLRVMVRHMHCPTALASQHSRVDLQPVPTRPVRVSVDAIGKVTIPGPEDMSRGASGVSQEDVLRAGATIDTIAAQQRQLRFNHIQL